MMNESINVKVFNADTLVSDETLQAVVDLYKEHDKFSDKDREERGVSSVEKLKDAIKGKVNFILAIDENTGEVVGAGKLDFIPDEKIQALWSNAIWVKNNEKYRGAGIGRKILEKMDEIFFETRKEYENVVLQCGIEPENIGSKEFHKKMGWQNFKSEDGSNYVYSGVDGGKKNEYELWEKLS